MSSSTSSSRWPVPSGALWALALVAAVEAGLHLLPASWFLLMDQHDYPHEDTLDYAAVDLAIKLLPRPDVLVVGTSRAREGVVSPTLAEGLEATLGRPFTVRNYGLAGGRIDIVVALVDRLAVADHLPEALVVALDASDFRDRKASEDRFRALDLGSVGEEIRRNGWPEEKQFSHVLGNSIPLRLVTARHTVRYRLFGRGDLDERAAFRTNAAFGGATGWAREYLAGLAGRNRPPKMRASPEHIERAARGYVLRHDRLDRLRVLVETAKAHGVRVILAEVPAAPPVRSSPGVAKVQRKLRNQLATMADGRAVSLCTSAEAADAFGLEEFRDASHLNARGAARFTQFLVPLVAEALREERP